MELIIGRNYTHEELEDELTRAQGFSKEKMSILLTLEMIQNMHDEVIEEVGKLVAESERHIKTEEDEMRDDWLSQKYVKLMKRTQISKRDVGNIATLLVSDAKYTKQED